MLAPRSLIVTSGLILLACADARGQQPITRNGLRIDLLGCYVLYSGPGRSGGSLYNASPLVRLDSLGVSRLGSDTVPGIARALVPLNASSEPVTPPRPRPGGASWTADSLTDTVRLSFV